jgi:hypothetical protein
MKKLSKFQMEIVTEIIKNKGDCSEMDTDRICGFDNKSSERCPFCVNRGDQVSFCIPSKMEEKMNVDYNNYIYQKAVKLKFKLIIGALLD